MAKAILDGVDKIINGALGLSGGRLKYHHKAQCLLLSDAPTPDLDVPDLIRNICAKIKSNWHKGKSRSTENWRWTQNADIDSKNTSQEVVLERWIARTAGKEWANQVPVASGLTDTAGGRRAIDLIHRCGNKRYEFIELKVNEGGGTPLFAAMEILQYGILYMFSRENAQKLANEQADPGLFAAIEINLKVLAPAKYYEGYDLSWLEKCISDGLASYTAESGCGFTIDFTFESLSLVPSGSPVSWKANHR